MSRNTAFFFARISILATYSLYLSCTFVEKKKMENYFNKRKRVPSLIEEAMMGRMYDEPREDENNKPKTNVVVRTNRLYYGKIVQ